MKNLKKYLCLFMALTTILSLATACVDEGNSSSSSGKDLEDIYVDTYPENGGCTFGEWTLVKNADCTTKGVKVRHCSLHDGHDDYEFFAARQHAYDEKGICERCGEALPRPTPEAGAQYVFLPDDEADVIGSGEEYPDPNVRYSGAYQFSAGEYYEIELTSTGECWFEFSVSEPGHYAVVSTANPDGVTISGYTPETHYYIADGGMQEDGNFVAVVSCTENYWSPAWKATYALKGKSGNKVKFFITKVAPPTWEAGYVNVSRTAAETLVKAEDAEDGYFPLDVPYTDEYFYDESCGYYRRGNKEEPGEIIYMAITKTAPRLMGEQSFVSLQGNGAGLRCAVGKTIEGDHIIHDFAAMIYKDPAYGGTENSYEAFVNADGLYPVNKELYEFLTLYTEKNAVDDENDSLNDSNKWLAACFYYGKLTPGCAQYPIRIQDFDTYTGTQLNIYDKLYYKFVPVADADAPESGTINCKLTVQTAGTCFWINGERHFAEDGAVEFEVVITQGATIEFLHESMNADALPEITFTIEKVVDATPEN